MSSRRVISGDGPSRVAATRSRSLRNWRSVRGSISLDRRAMTSRSTWVSSSTAMSAATRSQFSRNSVSSSGARTGRTTSSMIWILIRRSCSGVAR
ncbi:MAG TPA: hypothetical protein DCQ64_27810 [Candidatus Rokubacteria bacterium]|nr:hypothetical protein [Candidatus Rokubacteria bacterium]